MQVPIKHKTSSVAGKVPALADVQLGELAINTHDGKLYTRKDDGTPVIMELGGGGSLALSASPTAAYTLLASDAGKYVSIEAGGSIVVPTGVFEPGNLIMLFNNTGADATIDTAGLDSYIAGEDGNISSGKIRPRGVVYVYFLSATMCLLFGNIIGPVFVDYTAVTPKSVSYRVT